MSLSNEFLNILIESDMLNSPLKKSYAFVYDDLQRVLNHKSRGNMRVRFVSRSLFTRKDVLRHVYLEFQHGYPLRKNNVRNASHDHTLYVAEHAPAWSYMLDDDSLHSWKEEVSIKLPNVPFSLDEIVAFDESVSPLYVLGISDCRHHVHNMLKLCYPIESFDDSEKTT